MMSRISLFVFLSGLLSLWGQTDSWQPLPGHTQLRIWPGKVPDAQIGENRYSVPYSGCCAAGANEKPKGTEARIVIYHGEWHRLGRKQSEAALSSSVTEEADDLEGRI
jgi:hypothetical protein